MMLFKNIIQEIPLVMGVSISLTLAFFFGNLGLKDFKLIAYKMKPWNFAFIILGMFLFLHIFKASDTPRVIAETMTPLIFAVMFFAVYQGYVISPVHPCVSVSLEFFKTELLDFYKSLTMPALIGIGLAWITGVSTF